MQDNHTIRAKCFELVDNEGRVRAELKMSSGAGKNGVPSPGLYLYDQAGALRICLSLLDIDGEEFPVLDLQDEFTNGVLSLVVEAGTGAPKLILDGDDAVDLRAFVLERLGRGLLSEIHRLRKELVQTENEWYESMARLAYPQMPPKQEARRSACNENRQTSKKLNG